MKKVAIVILCLFGLAKPAFAQVGININIGYSSGYYNPYTYYGSGLNYGYGYGYSSLYSVLPFLGYGIYSHYDSPYRYQTVTPPNPELYNALVAQGEEKMANYYQSKAIEQQQMPVDQQDSVTTKKEELVAPQIEVFKQDQEI